MSSIRSKWAGSAPEQYRVGVGLRHPHYREALLGASSIDFVEIHAENFFAEGGVIQEILTDMTNIYPVSLHSTSMGLGSAMGINQGYLKKLQRLAERIRPLHISDHACFTWGTLGDKPVHAGDLLPLEFTRQSLTVMSDNIDRVQQLLGRRILIENLSAYVEFKHSTLSETGFLTELVERTGCGLLVDLNNLLVNAHNFSDEPAAEAAKHWLQQIPADAVGEIHLAGYTPAERGALIVDDHSQPVSDECWALYRYALQQVGPVSTLIEWDNQLPDWETLLAQAVQARTIIHSELNQRGGMAHAS
ncbi:DUF692 domain-containing protein [Neptuniibacter halophilus]|uniref:DUF692 domain-containing protein n=1 Tax=Neptuniibacter halophilus TaxID=651666 RepID=UPI00257257C5|nr:DUF692 domain-containing protein [Neptuniibacter halophilus]